MAGYDVELRLEVAQKQFVLEAVIEQLMAENERLRRRVKELKAELLDSIDREERIKEVI